MDRARELDLVSRVRAGDVTAFDDIHDAFNSRLFNFLARLSNRRDVAEDLVEETWLRFVRHARRLHPETRLGAWLFTVARHLHVSYCRSRQLEDSRSIELCGLWPPAAPAPSPLEAMEADEAQQVLAAALASLPVIYREALLLTAVEGLRPLEASQICGVSCETMRQRVSRGRALLARRMEEVRASGLRLLKEVTT